MTHFLDTLLVNSLPAIRAGTAGLLSDSYYVETPVHINRASGLGRHAAGGYGPVRTMPPRRSRP